MNKNWKITNDSIISDNGTEIKFTDERAFPIFVTKRFGVLCGNNGNTHSNILNGDLNTLAVKKAIKLISTVPDFLEDYMSDIDFSDCALKYDKAVKCADAIKNDIYCEGRVFELENETVFLLWKELPENVKNDIAKSVCQEKYIENTNIVFASNKNYKLDKLASPDGITIDGVEYGYQNGHSTPFIVFRDKSDKIAYGQKNDIHALLLSRIKKSLAKKAMEMSNTTDFNRINKMVEKKLDETAVVEGRVWDLTSECDKVVFSFWSEYQPYNIKDIIRRICENLKLDFNKSYCARNHELIYVPDASYIPTDSDYAGMETDFDFEEYQKELDKIHQNHNPEYVPGRGYENRSDFEARKKDDTASFRNDRAEKWANNHRNDNGTVPTKAEWNFRTKMDESRGNLEAIINGTTSSADGCEFDGNKLIVHNGTPFILYTLDNKLHIKCGNVGEKHYEFKYDLLNFINTILLPKKFGDFGASVIKNYRPYFRKTPGLNIGGVAYVANRIKGNQNAEKWIMGSYTFKLKNGKSVTRDNFNGNTMEEKIQNMIDKYYEFLREVPKCLLLEGRAWPLNDGRTVFAFWELMREGGFSFGPITKVRCAKMFCELTERDFDKAYILLNKGLNNFVKASEANALELNDTEEELSTLEKMKQQHINGEVVGGEEFVQNRDDVWSNSHMNDDGTVPTRAEWNFRTKMDENKK